MSFMRWDRLHQVWVLDAAGRAERPDEFGADEARRPARCPFCPGHEADTPPALMMVPAAAETGGQVDWLVRCVPNRYPAVGGPGGPTGGVEPDRERRIAAGDHEIVIESPWHESRFDDLPAAHAASVLDVIRQRMAAMRAGRSTASVLTFKNHGGLAGASLAHGHVQIISLPFVPNLLQTELRAFERHAASTGSCLLCEMVESERQRGQRVVAEGDGVVALAPVASRFAFELLVVPTDHESVFEETPGQRLVGLAAILQLSLARLRARAGDPPFNLVVHTAPPAGRGAARGADASGPGSQGLYHWHIEILPRVGRPAGFEWGTGGAINSVSPERAAAILRGEPGR